jgi:hypothetical protein
VEGKDGSKKTEQLNHHTPNSFRDSVKGIFNRKKKNLLKHATTVRGAYEFAEWAKSAADPDLGGLGYLRKAHVDRSCETRAILMSMPSDDPKGGPTLSYQTLRDLERSKVKCGAFKFDKWKTSGKGIKIFADGVSVTADGVKCGGYSDKFDFALFSSALRNDVRKLGGLGGNLTDDEIAQYDTFIQSEIPEDEVH